jgi:hypothetical protein
MGPEEDAERPRASALRILAVAVPVGMALVALAESVLIGAGAVHLCGWPATLLWGPSVVFVSVFAGQDRTLEGGDLVLGALLLLVGLQSPAHDRGPDQVAGAARREHADEHHARARRGERPLWAPAAFRQLPSEESASVPTPPSR